MNGAAGDRDRVDVRVPIVLGAERDQVPVRGKDRVGLDADVAGQPAGVLAVSAGDPQVVGVDERDVPGGHRRHGQQAGVVGVGRQAERTEDRDRREGGPEAWGHGNLRVRGA